MKPNELTAGLYPYENISGTRLEQAKQRVADSLSQGWTHRNRYAPLRYDEPWPWMDEATANSARNFHLHAWDMISDFLLAHSHTGDRALFDASVAVAKDWIARFPVWQREGQPIFAWYDMAVGLRAHRLAYLLDAGERLGLLDAHEQRSLWDSLVQHQLYLQEDENIIFHNNHGFYQVFGQLAMGRRFEARAVAMANARKLGGARLKQMINNQFTGEGVHREHSPDYHRMVYTSLRGILAEGLIDSPELRELVRRIESALAWFVTPDGNLARFGDSDNRSVVYKPAHAQRQWETDEMLHVSSRGAIGTPPDSNVKVFQESGFFVAKDAWPAAGQPYGEESYLAQIAAFHSRAHKHADDLSIIWYEQGEEILVDAGRYGYLGKAEPGSALWADGYWYSDPARVYVESTRAHNTVEIDGRNHPRKGVRPYQSALGRTGTSAQGIIHCESEVRHGCVRFIRHLMWMPGEWLVVYDWLKSGMSKRHDFRQWFHLAPTLDPVVSGAQVTVTMPRTNRQLAISPLLTAGEGVRVVRGERPENGGYQQGFHSPSDGVLVESPAVVFEHLQAGTAAFATLFAFGDVAGRPDSGVASGSGQSVRLEWTRDGRNHRLKLNRKPGAPIQIQFS